MVRLIRCLILAQINPKLHHKEAKQRFIVRIAVSGQFLNLKDLKSVKLYVEDPLGLYVSVAILYYFRVLLWQPLPLLT